MPGENITSTKVSSDALRNVIIYDVTPAFTKFVSRRNGAMPLDLTSERDGISTLEFAVEPDRVEIARFRMGEKESDLKSSGRGKKAQRFSGTFSPAGLVSAWLQLLPKELELSD